MGYAKSHNKIIGKLIQRRTLMQLQLLEAPNQAVSTEAIQNVHTKPIT